MKKGQRERLNHQFADLFSLLKRLAHAERKVHRRQALAASTDIVYALHHALASDDVTDLAEPSGWARASLSRRQMAPIFGESPRQSTKAQLRFLDVVRRSSRPVFLQAPKPDAVVLERAALDFLMGLDDTVTAILPMSAAVSEDAIRRALKRLAMRDKADLESVARDLLRACGVPRPEVKKLFHGAAVEGYLAKYSDLRVK